MSLSSKTLSLILLASAAVHLNAASKTSLYRHTAAEFTKAYKGASDEITGSRVKFSQKKTDKKVDEQARLRESKIRQKLYDVLGTYDEQNRNVSLPEGDTSVEDLQLIWQSLRLFSGDKFDPSANLAGKIDMTESKVGSVVLERMLATPLIEQKQLLKRQNAVKKLVQNDELYKKLKTILKKYSKVESSLLRFYLGLADFVDIPSILMMVAIMNLPDGTFRKQMVINSYLNVFEDTQGFYINTCFSTPIITAAALAGAAAGGYFSYQTFGEDKKMAAAFAGGSLLSAGVGAGWIYIMKEVLKEKRAERKILVDVADIVRLSEELESLISNDPDLAQASDLLPEIQLLTTGSNLPLLQDLISTLKTGTFKGSRNFPSIVGRIKKCIYRILKQKNNFVGALEAIGEIDAYCAIAELYRSNNNATNHFCFANFITSNRPQLKLDAVWDPFIGSQNAIANDLNLGQLSNVYNVLITGPNAGGKSTFMRSVLESVVLAQTFGICPASEATMTPFSYIGSYANVEDVPSADSSRFKEEVRQVNRLMNKIDALPSKKYGLFMADELFSGTDPIHASSIAQAVAEEIAYGHKSLGLFSTHITELSRLEQVTNGKITNHHVEILRNPDKSFDRFTFKILPGATTESTAFDILHQEQFDPEIIQTAHQLKQSLTGAR